MCPKRSITLTTWRPLPTSKHKTLRSYLAIIYNRLQKIIFRVSRYIPAGLREAMLRGPLQLPAERDELLPLVEQKSFNRIHIKLGNPTCRTLSISDKYRRLYMDTWNILSAPFSFKILRGFTASWANRRHRYKYRPWRCGLLRAKMCFVRVKIKSRNI
jgi:hypothetical protein